MIPDRDVIQPPRLKGTASICYKTQSIKFQIVFKPQNSTKTVMEIFQAKVPLIKFQENAQSDESMKDILTDFSVVYIMEVSRVCSVKFWRI